MKNWKTTLAGAVAALGAYCKNSPDSKLHTLGNILEPLGIYLLGHVAADSAAPSAAASKQIPLLGILAPILALALFSGCAISDYAAADGTKFHQVSFFEKESFKGLAVNPKTGYRVQSSDSSVDSDGINALTSLIEKSTAAAVSGAIKGAVPVPK